MRLLKSSQPNTHEASRKVPWQLKPQGTNISPTWGSWENHLQKVPLKGEYSMLVFCTGMWQCKIGFFSFAYASTNCILMSTGHVFFVALFPTRKAFSALGILMLCYSPSCSLQENGRNRRGLEWSELQVE